MRNNAPFFYIGAFFLALAIGIFFRFWKMPEMAMFQADQGVDLLVATRIVRGEHYPLVGPVLAIGNFYNPATYYYVLAFFVKLFSSETALFVGIAVLNILAGAFYADVLRRNTDVPTALVFFFFSMITHSNVQQGRMLWNPHMATFFLSASMWLFFTPWRRYRLFQYVFAVEIAAVGITIYPTGALLIPLYLFYGYQHILKMNTNRFRATALNIGVFILAFFGTSLSYVYYEFIHKFPSFHAILVSHMSGEADAKFIFFDSFFGSLQRGSRHIEAIYYLHYPQYFQNEFIMTYFPILSGFIIVSFILLFTQFRINVYWLRLKDFFVRFGYVYIALAATVYLFFDANIPTYRVLIFLPFSLYFISYVVRTGIVSPFLFSKLGSIVFVLIYVYMNSVSNIVDAKDNDTAYYQRYGHVLKLHSFITKDLRSKGLTLQSVGFRTITATPDYTNYEVMPLLYFLYKSNDYHVLMNTVGNDAIRSVTMTNSVEYAYVICFSQYITHAECWNRFIKENPNSKIIQETALKPYYIYLAKKEGSSWLTLPNRVNQ